MCHSLQVACRLHMAIPHTHLLPVILSCLPSCECIASSSSFWKTPATQTRRSIHTDVQTPPLHLLVEPQLVEVHSVSLPQRSRLTAVQLMNQMHLLCAQPSSSIACSSPINSEHGSHLVPFLRFLLTAGLTGCLMES